MKNKHQSITICKRHKTHVITVIFYKCCFTIFLGRQGQPSYINFTTKSSSSSAGLPDSTAAPCKPAQHTLTTVPTRCANFVSTHCLITYTTPVQLYHGRTAHPSHPPSSLFRLVMGAPPTWVTLPSSPRRPHYNPPALHLSIPCDNRLSTRYPHVRRPSVRLPTYSVAATWNFALFYPLVTLLFKLYSARSVGASCTSVRLVCPFT